MSQREPHRGRRDCAKARRVCVIHTEAAGVTQKAKKVAQSLSRLTQRSIGPTLDSEELLEICLSVGKPVWHPVVLENC